MNIPMNSVLQSLDRRVALALVAIVATFASVLALGLIDNADAQPATDCSGDIVETLGNVDFGTTGKVYSNTLGPDRVTSRSFAVSVPAGTYNLVATSYDGYNDRPNSATQANEIWVADFVSGGTVLATSSPTVDLADGLEATWKGPIGTVTLPSDVDTIVVRHGFLTNLSPNSVKPICIGFTDVTPPPQTTTVPETTVPDTTTPDTTVPDTTVPDTTTPDTTVPDTTTPDTSIPATTVPGNPCSDGAVVPGVTINPDTGDFCVAVLGTTELPPVTPTDPPVTPTTPATPATCEPPLVAGADGTCVGGAVQIAPVAQPVAGNPNFTG